MRRRNHYRRSAEAHVWSGRRDPAGQRLQGKDTEIHSGAYVDGKRYLFRKNRLKRIYRNDRLYVVTVFYKLLALFQ